MQSGPTTDKHQELDLSKISDLIIWGSGEGEKLREKGFRIVGV
jgi:hypothetical protein